MESLEDLTMEGVNILLVVGVARKDILVRIVGKVHRFASIAARRVTSELVSPFSFSMRCCTLHL